MNNEFLTNKSLEGLIKKIPFSNEDHRKRFLKRVPCLDKKERIGLLRVLKNIFLLDKEKQEAIKSVKLAKKKGK